MNEQIIPDELIEWIGKLNENSFDSDVLPIWRIIKTVWEYESDEAKDFGSGWHSVSGIGFEATKSGINKMSFEDQRQLLQAIFLYRLTQ